MTAQWRASLVLALVTLFLPTGSADEVQALVVDNGSGCRNTANPQIPWLGYGAITYSPNPPVVNEETTVHVRVRNGGGMPAEGVVVTLSWAEFGFGFEEGEEIGSTTTDISAGEEVVLSFTHVVRSRSRLSFVAQVKSVENGGNCHTWDDTGVVNLDLLHVEVGGNATFDLPVRNTGSEPLAVKELEVFCFSYRGLTGNDLPFPREWGGGSGLFIDDWQGETGYLKLESGAFYDVWTGQNGENSYAIDWEPCPFEAKMFTADGEEIPALGELSVLPGEETVVQVLAAGFSEAAAEKGATFIAVWADVGGAPTHAAAMLKPASVEELLNSQLLCCLKKVRDRVRLGRSMLLALEAYQAGDVAGAIGMLRFVWEEVEQTGCEAEGTQSACLERLALMLQQIGRLMAAEGQLLSTSQDPEPVSEEPPTRRALLEFQIPEKVVMEKEADFYSRAGLPGAALATYQRAQIRFGSAKEEYSVGASSNGFSRRQTSASTQLLLPKEVVEQYEGLFGSSASFAAAASFNTDPYDSDTVILTVHVCHL